MIVYVLPATTKSTSTRALASPLRRMRPETFVGGRVAWLLKVKRLAYVFTFS